MAAEAAQLNNLPAQRDASEIPLSIRNMGKLAQVTPDDILQRYLSEETTHEIAADLGVTRQALSFFLLNKAPIGWQQAQVARALARKERADDEMKAARDPLALARAREELRSAQWDLERVCSRIYGQKSHVTVEQVGDLGDKLRRSRERVIEAEPVADAQHAAAQEAGVEKP